MEPKILYIIDDDDIFQFMIKKNLRLLEYNLEVKTYSNGKKAATGLIKDWKCKTPPDIILLDINMPVMDGWEFLKFFQDFKSKINKKIMIYIISSSTSPDDIYKAKEINALAGYISKPIHRDELKTIIEDLPQDHWVLSSA